jgi:hypothetical protein
MSDRVPLGCGIVANFISSRYAAQHPKGTGKPISEWDKCLLCRYKNSLSIDFGTKFTSHKNFSGKLTGLKNLKFCCVYFTSVQNLPPSLFSAPCKTYLLLYYMRRRISIPEQVLLYVRCGKSTPGFMRRPNKSYKLSGRSSWTLQNRRLFVSCLLFSLRFG